MMTVKWSLTVRVGGATCQTTPLHEAKIEVQIWREFEILTACCCFIYLFSLPETGYAMVLQIRNWLPTRRQKYMYPTMILDVVWYMYSMLANMNAIYHESPFTVRYLSSDNYKLI